MPAEFQFACPLRSGLHARPATIMAEKAAEWRAVVTLTNRRTGVAANAASVLDLVAAGVMEHDECLLTCTGEDEVQACSTLARFITAELAGLDEPPLNVPAAVKGRIPKTLEAGAAGCFSALPASPGIGMGRLVLVDRLSLPAGDSLEETGDPERDLAAARQAFDAVQAQMQQRLAREENRQAREIGRALLALLADPALYNSVTAGIEGRRATARSAIVSAVHSYREKLLASASTYLRERCADLEEIGLLLLGKLPGAEIARREILLAESSILVAHTLGASQLLALDRTKLAGIVLETAGTTAHVVILARSLGIPCISGATWLGSIKGGEQGVIEGSFGLLATPVTAAVQRFYERERILAEKLAARWAGELHELPTGAGPRVEIAANIAAADEVEAALAHGADGVGLFRTEMLFTASAEEPDEEIQYAAYSRAAVALADRPLIIRTLDIGGDKPLPYLNLPQEDNPFLGCRGIRAYQQCQGLFRRQLRSIVRASVHGQVWVMAPMVSGIAEARWFREQIESVQEELAGQGILFNGDMPVGIMLEVPAAALAVRHLAGVVDFFSVGTNDLTQYVLAVERGNPAVADLYDELHPALLNLLERVVEQAHAQDKWVGLCGELARNPLCAPLLAGLGFDELSMSAPAIPAVRTALADAGDADCRQLAERVLACADSAQIRAELQGFRARKPQPLLDKALIEVAGDCQSKAEAIRELCALNFMSHRCTGINELEDAIWQREDTYSTGLGQGIAIPHCKADAVVAGSLAVLKLARPIEWGSLDEAPVDIVLMLTMPANDPGNRHLQVFAALSRRLMHEEFRNGLRAAGDPDSILSFLNDELNLHEVKGTDDA